MFGRSLQNYITASRVAQGKGDVLSATPEEKEDVVVRWHAMKEDLKPFYNMKEGRHRLSHRHSSKGKGLDDTESAPSESDTPRTGFWNTRHMSFDERKKLHAQKAAKKQLQQKTTGTTTPRTADSSSVYSISSEDAEFEQAIRASVKETSRGNPEEDVMVEAAIRASIRAMKDKGISIPQPEQVQASPEKDPSIFKDPEYQVTDEQYQALVEQALQKSVEGQAQGLHPASAGDDDEMKRAIEASMADVQKVDSQRTEEDIVMEYVKKQSLAEEEFRKKHPGATSGSTGKEKGEDEDLKRAMEESLKMNHGGGGPSGT